MGRTVKDAVFELLLAFPGTEETVTHGAPTFKVGGKTFAYWTVNHHDDGRLALWLAMDAEAQAHLVATDPATYFVPPYVGVKGWVGVDLGQGLAWNEACTRVAESWRHAAPPKIRKAHPDAFTDDVPVIEAPTEPVRPEDINPMLAGHAQEVLQGLAERCGRLPETVAENERTSATWRAGKRPFIRGRHDDRGRLKLLFLVGLAQQSMMLEDPRYGLPPYYGPSGWIELDVHDAVHWPEVEALMESAYRNVALKRMLKALDGV